MGRALFSQKYITTPAVREEPEPVVDPCEKWSVWNQFDPDSDDFFKDAQLEHFVDHPIQQDPEDDALHVVILEPVSSSSSTSSNDDLNDNDSPMAVGTDDPATLLAGAYTPVDWQQRFHEAGSDPRHPSRPTRVTHRTPRRVSAPRQQPTSDLLRVSSVPVFIPPPSYRHTATTTSIPDTMEQQEPVLSAPVPRSPVPRTVSVTPINIVSEPSLPSPLTPDSPSTPPPQIIYPAPNTLSPSPAPNVTPRILSWNRTSVASIGSPLTNPRARMSLSRIDTMAMAQHQYIPVFDGHY